MGKMPWTHLFTYMGEQVNNSEGCKTQWVRMPHSHEKKFQKQFFNHTPGSTDCIWTKYKGEEYILVNPKSMTLLCNIIIYNYKTLYGITVHWGYQCDNNKYFDACNRESLPSQATWSQRRPVAFFSYNIIQPQYFRE